MVAHPESRFRSGVSDDLVRDFDDQRDALVLWMLNSAADVCLTRPQTPRSRRVPTGSRCSQSASRRRRSRGLRRHLRRAARTRSTVPVPSCHTTGRRRRDRHVHRALRTARGRTPPACSASPPAAATRAAELRPADVESPVVRRVRLRVDGDRPMIRRVAVRALLAPVRESRLRVVRDRLIARMSGRHPARASDDEIVVYCLECAKRVVRLKTNGLAR
jgi:hypothetical protein